MEGEPYRLAEEAYRLQQNQDVNGALHAVDGALALAPGHPQLLAIKRELLFASGRLDESDTVNHSILAQQPGNAEARLFLVYLRQRQSRFAEALEAAGRISSDPATPKDVHQKTRSAMVDLLQAMGRPAEALTALETLEGEPSLVDQSRRAFLVLACGRPEAACPEFEKALAMAPPAEQRRTLLQGLCDAARGAKKPDLELKALEALRAQGPKDHRVALDLAYAYLGHQRDREALEQFRVALDSASPSGAWLDAGYAAKRAGKNAEAAGYFSKGIEARAKAGEREPVLDFGLRREVESLSRSWGLVSGTAYRQGGLLPGIESEQKVLQQGLEAYWQPEFLTRDGRMVQIFAQAFENLYSASASTTGGPTLQGAAGIRVKPLSSQNLVLTAEKLIKVGRFAMDDWMFRAAYSLDQGLDLRPWQSDWNYWSLYTEAASFAKTGQYVHQLELRAGHSWRIPVSDGRNVLSPHFVLAGDYDNRLLETSAAGLGAGASLRHWFREDRSHAPASWVELTIQGRTKLNSASRGGGVFVTLSCWF
ncbi:hypothetical protein [Geothrix sp. PMB-07]|uniref:NfrA family protein n=1 Tax=Geothrix sp. PMB-07 TaxID=3068640 RepID=UPI002740C2FE|nr:hypothetical protein [Geothrix sp. PMB-07]WLT33101.1 hypothetical protein Q9293_07170 [Geothrix sp. PMB-07]